MAKDKPDKQPKLETLSQYVKRTLEQKQLTMRDVEVRSQGGIADAYVANILKGLSRNPSVDKLKALAVGLGEPEDDVFKVARGLPLGDTQGRGGEPWPGNVLVNAMQRVVSSPELTSLLQALLQMSAKELKAVTQFIEKKSR
jgi:transcriptional regulator with XRE-family HTH domain